MRLVDYKQDPDSATRLIDAWTSNKTEGKITDIIPPGTLDSLTRLVLVNAIYLKAPWEQPFAQGATRKAAFQLTSSRAVQVDTMSAQLPSASYVRADGYQAARLLYAGRRLAMTIILPDGDLADFEGSLTGDRLHTTLAAPTAVPMLAMQLPKWNFRTTVSLGDILSAMGMPTALSQSADFSAMSKDEQLEISAVLHQGYIAVDEEGTEAAAATATVMTATAMPIATPMVVDRPFMFVIHDTATLTPLFVGRVVDPAS